MCNCSFFCLMLCLCLYVLCVFVCSVSKGYVDVLMDLILDEVFVNPAPYTDAMLAIRVPEDLSAQFNRPDKEEVIANFVSRFTRAAVWTRCRTRRHLDTLRGYAGPHRQEWRLGSCAPICPNTTTQIACRPSTGGACKEIERKKKTLAENVVVVLLFIWCSYFHVPMEIFLIVF